MAFEDSNFSSTRPRSAIKEVARTRTGKTAARYRAAAEEFAQRAVGTLGEKIRAIVFYGPAVQGKNPGDDGVRLLVVTDDSSLATRDQLYSCVTAVEMSYEFGLALRLQLTTPQDFLHAVRAGKSDIIGILKEGIILHNDGTIARACQLIVAAPPSDAI